MRLKAESEASSDHRGFSILHSGLEFIYSHRGGQIPPLNSQVVSHFGMVGKVIFLVTILLCSCSKMQPEVLCNKGFQLCNSKTSFSKLANM